MGLFKAAVIGGVAYYFFKNCGEKNTDSESNCPWKSRRTDRPVESRGLSDDETAAVPYQSSMNPPSYPHDQYPFSYGVADQYYNDKKQPQQQQPQTMTEQRELPSPQYQPIEILEPRQTYRVGGMTKADMVIEQAMVHLRSGQEGKAKELLGRAMRS